MKDEIKINANLIVLKTQIDALKNLLNDEQKVEFNKAIAARQKTILSTYKDNQVLSKNDFDSMFELAKIQK